MRENMTTKLEIALHYAEGGMHILPAMAGEKGAWLKEWQHRATTDTATIRTWWELNPNSNIGWHPGPSGFIVIDLDREPGLRYFQERIFSWDPDSQAPPTRCHRTPNGYHLIYQVPAGESIGSGTIWRQEDPKGGVDFKSNGGYVLMPGSVVAGNGYGFRQDSPDIRMLPEAWLPLFDKPVEPKSGGDWDWTSGKVDPGCRYCRGAVDSAIANIASRPEGDRNDFLNSETYSLHRLPCFDRQEVYGLLVAAAQSSGLGDREIRATLKSAIGSAEREWGPQGAMENCEGFQRVSVAAPTVVPVIGPIDDDDGGWMRASEAKLVPTQVIVDDLIIRHKNALFYGEGGSSKTTFASYLAIQHFLATNRGGLVLVNEEDPEDVHARWVMMGGDPDSVLVRRADKPIRSGEELAKVFDKGDRMLRKAGYDGVGSLIVDPITEFLGGARLKELNEVRGALMPWARVTKENDLMTICISHTNKDESVTAANALYGSTGFRDSFRSVVYIGYDPEEEGDKLARAAVVTKSNKLPIGVGWRFRLGLAPLAGVDIEDEDGFSKPIEEIFVEEVVAKGCQIDASKMRLLQFGKEDSKGNRKMDVVNAIRNELFQRGFVIKKDYKEMLLDQGVSGYAWEVASNTVSQVDEHWVLEIKPGFQSKVGGWVNRQIEGSDIVEAAKAFRVSEEVVRGWLK